MQRVFVSQPAPAGEDILLEPDDAHHLTRVVRLRVGSRLWVSDGAGREAEAELVRVEGGQAWVRPGPWRLAANEPLVQVTLLQAIPKGERMDWLIQKATELGAYRIVPLLTERGVVRWDDPRRARSRRDRWQRIAREAARQVQRTRIPEVTDPTGLADALGLFAREEGARGFIPWEELPPLVLRDVLQKESPAEQVYVFIGPEGGWDPAEIEMARASGVDPVNLGPRILRSETAGLAALTLIMALWGDPR